MTNNERETSTGDVRLRDVDEDDLPTFFEQQLDPDATHMAAFPSRPRDAFVRHWLGILANDRGDKHTILFDGQIAGNIVSWTQDGEREVGYWLGKDFWGKGIATRALALLLQQVLERPIYAHVIRHNIGSRRVLEKSGFVIVDEGDEEIVLVLK